MLNFKINFTVSPYLLLLLIPALFVTFFFYFRLGKRIRRQPNRIVSVVLHTLVVVLSIVALSGMYFTWEEENIENELVILSDASYTSTYAKDRSDAFIHEVLRANNGRSKVAIVKFGYTQVRALEMGDMDADEAFDKYLKAEEPDVTATDICSALTYVWDPYENVSGGKDGAIISDPEMARILIVSDGLQTDRDAMSIAKLISLDGVRIDTAFYPTNPASDAWIVGATFPDKSFALGEEFQMELSVRSTFQGELSFSLFDNGAEEFEGSKVLSGYGVESITFPYKFTSPGHHELEFRIASEGDALKENNTYFCYYDLQIDNALLIVERYKGESDEILNLIKNRPDFSLLRVEVISVEEFVTLDLGGLQMYDEIILVNVANSDMPESFVNILENYVSVCGGGLFTVGGAERGSDGKIVMTTNAEGEQVPLPHAYNADDMKGSLYHAMLPVEVSPYTPPVALAIIIDRSGSMRDTDKLDTAIPLALSALDALSPRDYVAVIALNDWFEDTTPLTPMTQRGTIENSIRDIASRFGGGTNYTLTLDHACKSLCTMNIERRHILFLTDGQPGETNDFGYVGVMRDYYEKFGITVTAIGVDDSDTRSLKGIADAGGGKVYSLTRDSVGEMPKIMKEALNVKELAGAIVEEYYPQLGKRSTIVEGITQTQLSDIKMTGIYTSRLKSTGGAVDPLKSERGPLYAQWSYGNGKVGSFMTDLNSYFSENFLLSQVGRKILNNVVSTLMPHLDVKTRSLDAEFIEDNYRTQASVFGYSGEESQNKLIAFVKRPESSGGKVEKFDLSILSASGNRFTFENREVGVHEVTILEVKKSFDLASPAIQSANDVPESEISAILQTYRIFNFSEEFDPSKDPYAEGKKLLIDLSSRTDAEGEDKLITDADTLLLSLIRLQKEYDPRMLFILIALILFIFDVALRKFKFDFLKKYFTKSGREISRMKKGKGSGERA